jgi:hypothetical protein
VVGHEPVPYVALCDGAGNAEAIAKRALTLLTTLLKETTLGQLLKDETSLRWGKAAWRGLQRALAIDRDPILVANVKASPSSGNGWVLAGKAGQENGSPP